MKMLGCSSKLTFASLHETTYIFFGIFLCSLSPFCFIPPSLVRRTSWRVGNWGLLLQFLNFCLSHSLVRGTVTRFISPLSPCDPFTTQQNWTRDQDVWFIAWLAGEKHFGNCSRLVCRRWIFSPIFKFLKFAILDPAYGAHCCVLIMGRHYLQLLVYWVGQCMLHKFDWVGILNDIKNQWMIMKIQKLWVNDY